MVNDCRGAACYEDIFWSFTQCSRLCVEGELDDDGHGVMFLVTSGRLQCHLLGYLSSKFLMSLFNAFCHAIFALSIFYAI